MARHQPARQDQARACFERAVKHHLAGEASDALAQYRQALSHDAAFAEAHNNLGTLLAQSGQPDDALRAFRRAVELQPAYAEAYNNLGIFLGTRRDFADAVAAFERAVAIDGTRPIWLNNLGNALVELFRFEPALAAYDRAIALDASYMEAWSNRGVALRGLRRPDDAVASFQRALSISPHYLDALNNLGIVLKECRRFDEAIATFERGIATLPQGAKATVPLMTNLAVVYEELARHDEAERIARRALAIDPGYFEAFNVLGNCAFERGEYDAALVEYEKALAADPENPNANWNLAIIWLVRGDFERGWKQFEWRTRLHAVSFDHGSYDRPVWDGSPLAGRTILVHTEQGIGDAIQFIRYAAELKAAGAGRVVVECPGTIIPLLAGVAGVDEFVARGAPLPPYDVHTLLLSLPMHLGTRVDTVPAPVPYIPVAPRPVAAMVEAPVGTLKVGIVWAGNPQHQRDRIRSVALERLRPIFDVPGTRFFSLQKGAPAGALAALGAANVVDLAPHLDDLRDTAAAIARLDLVITVDTAVAHLAGALGARTWVLLPHVPDFRWLLGRTDSPWYPTARLFRQPRPMAWDAVISDVAAALRTLGVEASTTTLASVASAAMAPAEAEPSTVLEAATTTPAGRRFELAIPLRRLANAAAFAEYEAELVHGGYERLERDFLDELLRPGDVLIDAAPGLGLVALSAATAPVQGGSIEVRAVESDPLRAATLRRHAAANRIDGGRFTVESSIDAALARGVPTSGRVIVRAGPETTLAPLAATLAASPVRSRVAAILAPRGFSLTAWQSSREQSTLPTLVPLAIDRSADGADIILDQIEEADPAKAARSVLLIAEWTLDQLDGTAPGAPASTAAPAPRPAGAPRRIAFDWAIGADSGWGVYGLNLATHLVRRGDPLPLMLAPAALAELPPMARHRLAQSVAEANDIAQLLQRQPNDRIDVGGVLLRGLGNNFSGSSLWPRFKARVDVGVVFFEDTVLDAEALERARSLDLIIAGSTWNADILKGYGIDHVRVSLQGIDPTVFHPAPRSGQLADRFVIFSGGKLEFRKGQDIVVAAFRRFRERHPDALLMTAWHNPWPQLISDLSLAGHVQGAPGVSNGMLQVQPWLAANGIPDGSVLDLGRVANPLMGQLVREADVALFANRCEGGTNLVAMETMAAGVPTIVSANTGHLDLVATGGCLPLHAQRAVPTPTRFFRGTDGWGESDVAEIVDTLERVYADRKGAAAIARTGADAMARLAWQHRIDHLVSILSPLL
jgi:tetratricopeptide (TPR) repeat protein/glycosyltransferase involved in cell wall biosynthesis